MKKLVSLLLALLMVMGMASAFAEDAEGITIPLIYPRTTGSITVTNPVATQTYKAYKIFDLALSGDNYAYTLDPNSEWKEVLLAYAEKEGSGLTLKLANNDTVYVVTTTDAFSAVDFVDHLKEFMPEDATPTGSFENPTPNGATVSHGLPLGYYFVTSTLGTLCSLTTVTPNIEIEEKNEAPEVKKEVKEDSTGDWGETNDAEIGETVEFQATITAKPGAEGYVLHDKMSEGLTLNADSIVVKVGETVLEDGTHYTLAVASETVTFDDDCDFEIAFQQTYLDTITADTVIVVTYSAVVNEDAVIAGTGNPNEVVLDYGDENNVQTTPPSQTITYVWDMDVEKFAYVMTDGVKTEKNLEGATFVLKQVVAGDEVVVKMTQVESTTTYKVDPKGTVTSITTDATGKFTVSGLDSGTYYLYETEAPEGYNILTAPIKVVVDTKGELTITIGDVETPADTVKVENTSGNVLPSTGGMGTTMLYAVGGLLVLVAFVLIVSKRRASEN